MNRSKTKPGLTALTDTELRNSRALDAFIAFHRETFGGHRMDGDKGKGEKDDGTGDDKSKGGDVDKGGKDDADKGKGGSDKKVGANGNRLDDQGNDLGFPADTPVADMNPTQELAYQRHQARRHEERNKQLLKITGGKTPDQIKADGEELERLRNEKRTDSEKAVEEAKKAAKAEARKEFAPKLVRMAFDSALSHLKKEDREELVETLDLSKFIDDNNDVDTAKVTAVAKKIAPAGKGAGGKEDRIDYGGGQRDRSGEKPGSAGRAEAERRFKKDDVKAS